MRFSLIKKPLALLLVLVMIGAAGLMAAKSVESQQFGQGQGYEPGTAGGGGYAVPGAPGISLGPGSNTVAMSVSIASQQDNQIYFQVNSFAVMDQRTQAFTVYELSKALPGIMDTETNRVQIDIARLQSSITSTSQASMDDLYSILRPSVNALMVVADITQQGQESSRATFQVRGLRVIMPDGQTNAFDLSQPMAIVVDASAMRVFTVGFEQMYSLVNTYIVNIQNNYYTEINYNVVTGPTIIVTPPAVYPVLTPIRFPAAWPIYYPVPVPVPIPVVTVKPRPPSATPTMVPTGSPTGMPTISPTGKPTVSPTGMPTGSPTGKPTITGTPTGTATVKPSPKPTKGPIGTFNPSLFPTKVVSPKPTLKGPIATLRPSLLPTAIASPKPTIKSPIATFKPTKPGAALPTKLPVSTKTPVGTIKPIGPITTKKPVGGGGAPIATYRAPVVGKPTKTPAGGGAPIATYKAPVVSKPTKSPAGGKVPVATYKAPTGGRIPRATIRA